MPGELYLASAPQVLPLPQRLNWLELNIRFILDLPSARNGETDHTLNSQKAK